LYVSVEKKEEAKRMSDAKGSKDVIWCKKEKILVGIEIKRKRRKKRVLSRRKGGRKDSKKIWNWKGKEGRKWWCIKCKRRRKKIRKK